MKKTATALLVLLMTACLALALAVSASAAYVWPTEYGGKTGLDWSYHRNAGYTDGRKNSDINAEVYQNKGESFAYRLIMLHAGCMELHADGSTYDSYARALLTYYNTDTGTSFAYPTEGLDSDSPAMIDLAVQKKLAELSETQKTRAAAEIQTYNDLLAAIQTLRENAYADRIIYQYDLLPIHPSRSSIQPCLVTAYECMHFVIKS